MESVEIVRLEREGSDSMTEAYKIIIAVRKIAFPTKQKSWDMKPNNKTFTTNKKIPFI